MTFQSLGDHLKRNTSLRTADAVHRVQKLLDQEIGISDVRVVRLTRDAITLAAPSALAAAALKMQRGRIKELLKVAHIQITVQNQITGP